MAKQSLKNKVYEILKDGNPHRSDEIVRKIFGTDDVNRIGLFNLHARCSDLRKEGYNIPNAKHDKDYPKLCWYQMEAEPLKEVKFYKPEPIQEPLIKLEPTRW